MNEASETARPMRPVDDHDHILGPATAPATLVEYGDYECPFCRELHPLVQELIQRTKGLRFVYRHFPLAHFHPNAARVAQAAEAAGAQGRFWEMHNEIYSGRHELDDSRLDQCARRAGLDVERYRKEMADGVYAAAVEQAFESALYGGVTGTPTLYLNAAPLSDIHTLEALLGAVTAAGATLIGASTEHRNWLERLRQFRIGKTRMHT